MPVAEVERRASLCRALLLALDGTVHLDQAGIMYGKDGPPVIAIDESSATPPFEQLRAGLLAQISSGQLARGSRLPTVRALADELGLAPNTVARAYRELEAAGIIETRGRNGSFVSEHEDAVTRDAQRAARDYAARIRQLGISRADAMSFIDVALDD